MQRLRFRIAALVAGLALALASCAANLSVPSVALAPQTMTPIAPDDPELKGRERVVLGEPSPPAIASASSSRAPQVTSLSSATRAAVTATPGAQDATPATRENLFDVITVLWGTDRKVEPINGKAGDSAPADPLLTTSSVPTKALHAKAGSERSERLATGLAVVTVPRTARATGTIPRPRQYTFLNLRYYSESENPQKHFTIASLRLLEPGELSPRANGLLDKSTRFKDQVLVFIHGYNSTFDDALYRTAQVAHDLEFDGLAAMYSWPSRGTLKDYSYDLNSAARAQAYLAEFLSRIARETRARRIHIVAHSLGNRPLIEALRSLQLSGDRAVRAKLGQIVLAAPDVDRDLFADITAKLDLGAGRTLYASNEDKALILSRQADGVPRAGDVPADGPLIVKGLDTIDISAASTKALLSANHNDYAERSHVLKDIQLLIDRGVRPPDQRFPLYMVAEGKGGRYWRYTPNK
ncbi:MAG: alpha/beta hydrolase [Hyphomicrobiaceae bacterium]